MKHSVLFLPKDEWQYRQRCRSALRHLLSTIGKTSFEATVLAYLQLATTAGRVATVWIANDGKPRVVASKGDDDYAALAVDALDEVPLPGVLVMRCDSSSVAARHLGAAGLIEEIRFGFPLGDDRRFFAFLGRLTNQAAWSAEEKSTVDGCVSLLGSIVTAHVRCLNGAQRADPSPVSAERKLTRAFEERGLTVRESETASKILLGYSTLAIALEFDISENTVKVHRKHLNQKLGVRSQAELFGFAYRVLMEGDTLYEA